MSQTVSNDDPYNVNFSTRGTPLYLPKEPDFGFTEEDDLDPLLRGFTSEIGARFKEFKLQGAPSSGDKIIGREVGDDKVEYTRNPLIAASVLSTHTIIDMKTSEKDVDISTDSWNFCGATTVIPTSQENTFNKCRKRNDFKNLEYVDAPALRIVIETTKVERIHATSSTGKSSMLGAKLKSSNSICNAYLQVANILQDGMLRTADMPDPKYLPSMLGGCNCPDAYRDPYNTYLYMKAYKGGGYDRLYGTATQEVKEAIALTENGTPTVPLIANGLRGDHELFFATMRNKVFVPPESIKNDYQEATLPTPLYEAAGGRNEIQSVESRLFATKDLVPRSAAAVLMERSLKIQKYCLSSVDIAGHKETEKSRKGRLRACFLGALRGNSAFINLANNKGCEGDVTKLMKENFKICVTGQPEFKLEHAEWLAAGGKGHYLNLNDLPLSEDIFIRKEVSGEESMKVSGIRLNVEGRTKFIPQTTVAKVGSYQINSSMREWADNLMSKLETYPQRPIPRGEVLTLYNENREWVNDDTLLIKQCGIDCASATTNTCVALISNDKRLANQMARTNNIWVALVDPLSVLECFSDKEWSATVTFTPDELHDKILPNDKFRENLSTFFKVYVDTGALHASLSKAEVVERAFERQVVIKRPVSSENRYGVRKETYDLEVRPPNSYLRFMVYTPQGLRNKKKRKTHSYSSSSLSSNYAWRTSVEMNHPNRLTHRNPRKFTYKG